MGRFVPKFRSIPLKTHAELEIGFVSQKGPDGTGSGSFRKAEYHSWKLNPHLANNFLEPAFA